MIVSFEKTGTERKEILFAREAYLLTGQIPRQPKIESNYAKRYTRGSKGLPDLSNVWIVVRS
ncbi:hypothetical protein DTL21_16275 [Bremerella cremea]|uniref:Uncharacterized protein n=1 Tax=Blastopirellula marina TaxID=124 RepID=A0A2S8FI37_9BACT|nr:hypothetical protein C5Y83_16260 [Blastopirellula marina]RCS44884.1 hypothetical protein DTL21_16275 [Bremerella cremea]